MSDAGDAGSGAAGIEKTFAAFEPDIDGASISDQQQMNQQLQQPNPQRQQSDPHLQFMQNMTKTMMEDNAREREEREKEKVELIE